MAELEGAALREALAGNKAGAGVGIGARGEAEGGEAVRQAITAKGGAGAKAAATGKAAGLKGAAVKGGAATKTAIAGKTVAAAKGAGAAGSVAKTAAGGSILSAKGLGLGLGLGLGAWGPVILGALGVTAAYAFLKKRQGDTYDQSETDAEIKEALK